MTVIRGDCVEVMVGMEPDSVDAIVTDPPYGIGFMGHQWDQPGEHGPLRRGPRNEPGHPPDPAGARRWPSKAGRDGPGDEEGSEVSGYPNVPECQCDRDDDSWVGEGVPMPMCDYHERRLRRLSWESLACMVIDYEAALAVVGPRLPMAREGRA